MLTGSSSVGNVKMNKNDIVFQCGFPGWGYGVIKQEKGFLIIKRRFGATLNQGVRETEEEAVDFCIRKRRTDERFVKMMREGQDASGRS